MPKQLKKWPSFTQTRNRETYPYDIWLKPGVIQKFEQGTDFPFTTQPENFKRTLRAAAESRGLHIHGVFDPRDPDRTNLYVEVGTGPNDRNCGCDFRED